MSSVELNIIERGLKGQGWTEEKGPITSGDLDKISEQRTNSSIALNALPTPFARFFVVKEAFRRALEELKNSEKSAGEAYSRIVSDTLDVFELLYNLSFHTKRWDESRKISILEWDIKANLSDLKRDVPILADSIDTYIKDDLKAVGGKLFFIVLSENGKDFLIGTSSPYTGFITPPDLDKAMEDNGKSNVSYMGARYEKFPRLHRKDDKGSYFNDIRLFGDREKNFKNYMFSLVDNKNLGKELNEFRDYIKHFEHLDPEIIKTWQPQTEPLRSADGTDLIINGLPIAVDKGISTVNFFNDTLIQLPFRLSRRFYKTMVFANDKEDRDYDYLLPISREALEIIDADFTCKCKVTATKIIVTLDYKGQEYRKEYNYDGHGGLGRIVRLAQENINFNLAVFPNILSPNLVENNYFKIMAVMNDSTTDYRPFSIDKLELQFYYKDNYKYLGIDTIDSGNLQAPFGVRPAVVRTRQNIERNLNASSKFYELFNHQFDAIKLRFGLDSGTCEGILFPVWEISQRTNYSYTYAVDLGTTNTYISCVRNNEEYEPEQLSMEEPMVSYLHDYRESPQYPLISLIEKGISSNCLKNFNTEFIPSLIDGRTYSFPIRTALCVPTGDRSKPSLFDNTNIAFFYEKATALGNQEILTDIKWQDSAEGYYKLRLFIRELLLIIKTDILKKNGLLSETKIVWFRPLSFKGSAFDNYTRIWKEESKYILGIGASQIECVSESEAPYYYFHKKRSFENVDSVSIVDIGGGSSDFIYFADSRPVIANSVHFGCDILWGNGFNEFENVRDNGIFRKYSDSIHFEDEELEKLNAQMQENRKTTTKDIINFWLNNDIQSGLTKRLRESYKPLFLYHFASIVYYMATMYKAKGLDCPRVVLFCGNGSRYIDGLLSSNIKTITEIVTLVFQEVYGDNIKKIQIILPDVRKESTCYGGLYRKKDVEVPQEFNFQGIDDKEYENVEALVKDFDNLRYRLLSSFSSFNNLYIRLLNILIRYSELEKFSQKEIIKEIITTGIEDSLNRNFKTQIKEALPESDIYHDSIFFLPIIDNILKLSRI